MMRVINMTDTAIQAADLDGGKWFPPTTYKCEGNVVVDMRNGVAFRDLSGFIRRRPDTIVVVTREVAATIDPDLFGQVRVPGAAVMAEGGFFAELYNPHSAR